MMRTYHKLIITLILVLGFSLSGLYAQDYPQLYFLTGFHWYSLGGAFSGPDWSESETQTFTSYSVNPLNIRSIHETYRFDGSIEYIHTDSTYAFDGAVELEQDFFTLRSPLRLWRYGSFPLYRISKISYDGYYLEDRLAYNPTGTDFSIKTWHTYNENRKLIGSVWKTLNPLQFTKIEVTLDDLERRIEEYRYVSPDSLTWTPNMRIEYIYTDQQFAQSQDFEKHYLYMPDYILREVQGYMQGTPPYLNDDYALSYVIETHASNQGEWYEPEYHCMNLQFDGDGVSLEYCNGIYFLNWNTAGLLTYIGADYEGSPGYTFTYSHTSDVSNSDQVNTAAIPLLVYPNPVRDQSSLEYSLSKASPMQISTYNIKGQLVKKESYPASNQKGSLSWAAKDAQGRALANGIYLIRMQAEGEVFTARVMVVK